MFRGALQAGSRRLRQLSSTRLQGDRPSQTSSHRPLPRCAPVDSDRVCFRVRISEADLELDRGDFALAISRYCRIRLPRAFSGHEVQKLQNYLLRAWTRAEGPARRGRGYDWVDLARKTGIAHERILAGRDVIVPILAAQERALLDQAGPAPSPKRRARAEEAAPRSRSVLPRGAGAFARALNQHMSRHGDSSWTLHAAITGPGDSLDKGTLRTWRRGHRRITFDEYWAIPENQELRALGMIGMAPGSRDPLLFELASAPPMADWIGKLCISWPGLERSWWRWAERNVMAVSAIHSESAFAQGMPDWQNLVLTWAELQVLPASWRNKLAEWRGIYLIFDVERTQSYIGSAYGQDNILGRWRAYAESGHGGNVKLRASNPGDLRFSILQRTSPDLLPEDVIALERSWKSRLHTRVHGLNLN